MRNFRSPSTAAGPLQGRRRWMRSAFGVAVGWTLLAPGLATAQRQGAQGKTVENATNHSDASDGDRVFMRSAAFRLSHDGALAELGRTRAQSGNVKAFAADWRSRTEKVQGELKKLAEENSATLPNDMTGEADQRIRAVANSSEAGFDRAFVKRAVEALTEEVELFQDSVRKMESEQLRKWAGDTLHGIRGDLARAQQLS